jgi:hypothetical protein
MQKVDSDSVWELMGHGKACKVCKWWINEGSQTGHCVYLPPKAAHNGYAVFPITYNYNWCSKFKKGEDVCTRKT